MTHSEERLTQIDREIADIAMAIYSDYRWHGIADPLMVMVDGFRRWKHLNWLEEARLDAFLGLSEKGETARFGPPPPIKPVAAPTIAPSNLSEVGSEDAMVTQA